MSDIISIISDIFLFAGAFFILTGAVGVLRMPDFYTRLHPASISDSLGLPLVIIGVMLRLEPGLITVKLLLLVIFSMIASPTASHALAKAAMHSKIIPIGENTPTKKKSTKKITQEKNNAG